MSYLFVGCGVVGVRGLGVSRFGELVASRIGVAFDRDQELPH
jgi:hypothetical protein